MALSVDRIANLGHELSRSPVFALKMDKIANLGHESNNFRMFDGSRRERIFLGERSEAAKSLVAREESLAFVSSLCRLLVAGDEFMAQIRDSVQNKAFFRQLVNPMAQIPNLVH